MIAHFSSFRVRQGTVKLSHNLKIFHYNQFADTICVVVFCSCIVVYYLFDVFIKD